MANAVIVTFLPDIFYPLRHGFKLPVKAWRKLSFENGFKLINLERGLTAALTSRPGGTQTVTESPPALHGGDSGRAELRKRVNFAEGSLLFRSIRTASSSLTY